MQVPHLTTDGDAIQRKDGWGARLRRRLWSVGRLFPVSTAVDSITTVSRLDASPHAVWSALVFYEEVQRPAPFVLRLLLPTPVRTRRDGNHAGDIVECTYSTGYLVKRIGVVQAPFVLTFDVLDQRLGIERCITTVAGSYAIRARDHGSEIALTTRYRGHLRPRALWRPIERMVAHNLHRHIVSGMRLKTMP